MHEDFIRINEQRLNWLEGYTKRINTKHPGVTGAYETEDDTWRIFSKRGTLLIKIGFSLYDKNIVYGYLAEASGELRYRRVKELSELISLISELEEINAFDK